jgi:hypothetical protein
MLETGTVSEMELSLSMIMETVPEIELYTIPDEINIFLFQTCFCLIQVLASIVRFEVFTAMKIYVEVIWVMIPCSIVVGY